MYDGNQCMCSYTKCKLFHGIYCSPSTMKGFSSLFYGLFTNTYESMLCKSIRCTLRMNSNLNFGTSGPHLWVQYFKCEFCVWTHIWFLCTYLCNLKAFDYVLFFVYELIRDLKSSLWFLQISKIKAWSI